MRKLYNIGMQRQTETNSKGRYVDPVIELYKKDIDRTLIRRNLRLTVEERFENLMRLQEFARDLRNAMTRAKPAT